MILPIDKLAAGMELADDLLNVNGMLLLGKGTLLTERHLRTLKSWGAESVNVVGGAGSPEGAGAGLSSMQPLELPAEVIRAAEARVKRRFAHVTIASDDVRVIRELALRRTGHLILEENQKPGRTPSAT